MKRYEPFFERFFTGVHGGIFNEYYEIYADPTPEELKGIIQSNTVSRAFRFGIDKNYVMYAFDSHLLHHEAEKKSETAISFIYRGIFEAKKIVPRQVPTEFVLKIYGTPLGSVNTKVKEMINHYLRGFDNYSIEIYNFIDGEYVKE